jgi:hypothetical protein
MRTVPGSPIRVCLGTNPNGSEVWNHKSPTTTGCLGGSRVNGSRWFRTRNGSGENVAMSARI